MYSTVLDFGSVCLANSIGPWYFNNTNQCLLPFVNSTIKPRVYITMTNNAYLSGWIYIPPWQHLAMWFTNSKRATFTITKELIAVLQGRRKMSDDRLFATSYRYEVRNPNAKMLQKALTLQKSRIEVKLLGDKLTVTYSVWYNWNCSCFC